METIVFAMETMVFPMKSRGFPPRGVGKAALFIKLCGMSPPQPVPKTGTGDRETKKVHVVNK